MMKDAATRMRERATPQWKEMVKDVKALAAHHQGYDVLRQYIMDHHTLHNLDVQDVVDLFEIFTTIKDTTTEEIP